MPTGPAGTIFLRDNSGRYWVVNPDTMERHEVLGPGTGQYDAAVLIYGNPYTKSSQIPEAWRQRQTAMFGQSDQIFLDMRLGFVQSDSWLDKMGGPQMPEQYIAGWIPDPWSGEYNPNPQDATSKTGVFYKANVSTTPAPTAAAGETEQERKAREARERAEMVEDARDYLRRILEPYGLESLIGTATDLVISGASEAQIWFKLRETEEFKVRFAGNEARRAAGLRELAPSEYVAWEEQMRSLMQTAGLPPGFYDQPEDFAGWIGSGVGPQLLADRINRGIRQVQAASPELRAELDRLIPGAGDSALLAYVMDPEQSTAAIEALYMRAQSTVGFQRAGFTLSDAVAEQAAQRAQELGLSIEQQNQQAAQATDFVAQRKALFTESVSEDKDLQEGVEGATAGFSLDDGTAADTIERRRKERVSTDKGGGGAAALQGGLSL